MLGLTMSLLAQAAAPAALTPAEPWQMDQGGCVLSRKFGEGDAQVTLGIKPNIGAPGGELVLVMPGRPSGRYEVDEGVIALDGGERSFPAVWSRVGRRDQSFNGVTVQPADKFWAALSSARAVTIDVGKRQQVRLELGPMANAVAALEQCRGERQVAARKR